MRNTRMRTGPQSETSVPHSQNAAFEPMPPSSQVPSLGAKPQPGHESSFGRVVPYWRWRPCSGAGEKKLAGLAKLRLWATLDRPSMARAPLGFCAAMWSISSNIWR
eukprot:scaffold69309_cov65-Phaeocystis_antarctica.AAC.2